MQTIGDKIRALRKAKHLKQGDLAKKLGMTSAQLCRIEGAKHAPSVKTIARVAKALRVSVSDLMSDTLPKDSEVKRCSSDEDRIYADTEKSAAILSDSLKLVRETAEPDDALISIKRQLLAKEAEYTKIENELGISSGTTLQLSFPFSGDERGAEILARALRTSCDVGSAPFSNLVEILESRNVRIAFIKTINEIQSRSFYNTASHVLTIAINKRLMPERQLYRIAYELGYACVFGSTGFNTVHETAAMHRFIRRFAAAFLMPEDALRAIAIQLALGPTNWTMGLLLQLKHKFGVTAETFAHRLEKVELLSPSLRKHFKEELRNYYEEHANAEPSPCLKPLAVDTRLALLKLRASPCPVQGMQEIT